MKTPLRILLGIVPIGAIVAVFGAGWSYSAKLRKGALLPGEPPKFDMEVVALTEGRVTLRPTSDAKRDGDWTQDGIFGIESPSGYGQVGRIVQIDEERVVREFLPIDG